MSGILALFGTEPLPAPPSLGAARSALARLGGGVTEEWTDRAEGAWLHVTRKDWELADDFASGTLILADAGLVVAADASLYHTGDLLRELRGVGVTPTGASPSHLLAAAYRAWGDDLTDHVEGDYAVVVWDRRRRRAFAARDITGRRALYFARIGGLFAIGSSVRAVLEMPGCPRGLNLANLGAQAAGLLWSAGEDTAFAAVRVLRSAESLSWSPAGLREPRRYWELPEQDRRPARADEAAEELRTLLRNAVHTRLAGARASGRAASGRLPSDGESPGRRAAGTTSVWLSGGWDSTAVFASGASLLGDRTREALRPVSISYPEGDPGREDELIRAVAERWDADVHWIDSCSIPLLDDLEARAGAMDEPPAHLYELWNRSLAAGTRAVGARVALDGSGGDSAFQVSDVAWADLLRSGRWLPLARNIGARRPVRGHLRRFLVEPFVPGIAWPLVDRLYGRRVRRHYLERPIARWVRPEFVRHHHLFERELRHLRQATSHSFAQRENHLYLTAPVWAWGAGFMTGALLDEGVEGRSPLLDRRVIEFALRRPTAERTSGPETKRLLRHAMGGLLPAHVLAPRTHRTGLTIGFSRSRMRAGYPALLERLFAEPLTLESLGIVDGARLRAAAENPAGGGDFERVNLFHVAKVEFWLRGWQAAVNPAPPAARDPMTVAAFAAAAAGA
jgi:asparagine synthase (glutamine-hydrolysing)